METAEMTLKTPRGTFRIHTLFESVEEANQNGWHHWFTFEDFAILNKDNTTGAAVNLKR